MTVGGFSSLCVDLFKEGGGLGNGEERQGDIGEEEGLIADTSVDLLEVGQETLDRGGGRGSHGMESRLVGGVLNADYLPSSPV